MPGRRAGVRVQVAAQVLTRAPGCSGANWVTEANGVYFVSSSDSGRSGPFESLDDALKDERFWIETSHPELRSDVIPVERLMGIGAALVGQQGLDILVNGRRFVRRGDDLVDAEADAKRRRRRKRATAVRQARPEARNP